MFHFAITNTNTEHKMLKNNNNNLFTNKSTLIQINHNMKLFTSSNRTSLKLLASLKIAFNLRKQLVIARAFSKRDYFKTCLQSSSTPKAPHHQHHQQLQAANRASANAILKTVPSRANARLALNHNNYQLLHKYQPKKMLNNNPNTAGSVKPIVNYFSNSFIDRCSDRRKNAQWIQDEMKRDKTVFIVFHVDKPFVNVNRANRSMYSLCKLTYQQVKHLLEYRQGDDKCNWIFLGLEYEKNKEFENECENEDDDSGAYLTSECHSPYSSPNMYNRGEHRSWFAIDASAFNVDIESVSKSLQLENGQFFEGNFLRLMAIQDPMESSIIAQVCVASHTSSCKSDFKK
jgi:hypothetical protein